MVKYLLDTNTVSDYFSLLLPSSGIRLLDAVIDKIPNISVITQIELLCWKTDAGTERNVADFIEDFKIFEISPTIIERCVAIRKNKKIKIPDAIIAATALAHNYTLITNNEVDFINIKGLKLFNPHKV